MNQVKISVVIPFYNAKDYITQAVESALNQLETGEVIIVEDNSPDGGLEICQYLAEKYPNVRLLRHADGKNHGAGSTRNLGIQNAVFPYIAFLDADDYYLPNRFSKTVEIFMNKKEVDGVYEAIGVTYQNLSVKESFKKLSFKEITTISEGVSPEDLFERIINGEIGHFSFDGFTIKKDAFHKTGLFSEELIFFEDTDLMFKLCAKAILYPGSIDNPIAIRRVHNQNRITYHLADKRKSYHTYEIMWMSLCQWGEKNLTPKQKKIVLRRFITHIRKIDTFSDFSWTDYLISRNKMIGLACNFPELFLDRYFWRRLIPSREIFTKHEQF